MTHAIGCDPKTHCQGCMRAGEGNSPSSPTEAKAAIDKHHQWVMDLVAKYNAEMAAAEAKDRTISELRLKVNRLEKQLSNLELKTRGVAWVAR